MTRNKLGRIAVTSLAATALAVTAIAAVGAARTGASASNTGKTNFVVTPSATQPVNGGKSFDFSGIGTYSGSLSATFTTTGTQIVRPDLSTGVQATASITGQVRNCALTNFPLSYTLTGRIDAHHSAIYSGSGVGTSGRTVLQIWLAGVQPATGRGTFEYRVNVHCSSAGHRLDGRQYSVFPPLRP
jgi:hypothetical protein